jgi:hypothetical protein
MPAMVGRRTVLKLTATATAGLGFLPRALAQIAKEPLLRGCLTEKIAGKNRRTLSHELINPSSTCCSGTHDYLGHLQIVALTSPAETFHNTVTIVHVAILTHLPFALEPRDGKAEAHDAA